MTVSLLLFQLFFRRDSRKKISEEMTNDHKLKNRILPSCRSVSMERSTRKGSSRVVWPALALRPTCRRRTRLCLLCLLHPSGPVCADHWVCRPGPCAVRAVQHSLRAPSTTGTVGKLSWKKMGRREGRVVIQTLTSLSFPLYFNQVLVFLFLQW